MSLKKKLGYMKFRIYCSFSHRKMAKNITLELTKEIEVYK
jgi:hypothetical protein